MVSKANVYKWRNNLACTAVYTVLEADKFMDQFEDKNFPFATAGTLQMGQLRYFGGLPLSGIALKYVSLEKAQVFLNYIAKYYTSKKENSAENSGEIIRKIAKIFANSEKTLLDLAQVADDSLRFPDEK